MLCKLDHVNVNVLDLDRGVEFLRIAFPALRTRGEGASTHEGWTAKWVHLGTDELYVCLNTTSKATAGRRDPRHETGINHVGFIVDDAGDLAAKYEAAGFKCAFMDERPSRKRLYVTDSDGITWEFIEYLSDDPAVRNDYAV